MTTTSDFRICPGPTAGPPVVSTSIKSSASDQAAASTNKKSNRRRLTAGCETGEADWPGAPPALWSRWRERAADIDSILVVERFFEIVDVAKICQLIVVGLAHQAA